MTYWDDVDLHCTVTKAFAVLSCPSPLLAVHTYIPASSLPLLRMFRFLDCETNCPFLVHVKEGVGKPDATQLITIGFVSFTVTFRGKTVNCTGTV